MNHEVALGDLAFVPWGQKQVLAAFTLVRSGGTEVGEVFENSIIVFIVYSCYFRFFAYCYFTSSISLGRQV